MYIEVETIECPCCKTKWQYATCLSRNNIQNAEPFKTDSIFECPSCGKKWVIGDDKQYAPFLEVHSNINLPKEFINIIITS